MNILRKKSSGFLSPSKLWMVLIFFYLLNCSESFAQNKPDISNLKPWQLKSFAKNATKLGDVYSAINYTERLIELVPGNDKNKYKLAELYRLSRDYVKAEKAYEKSYNIDKIKYIDALFYQALMQKMNRKYEKAKENFLKYVKESGKKGNAGLKKQSKIEIAGCDYYKSVKDVPDPVNINHLDPSINKAHVEFAPLPLSDSSLLYASLVADSVNYYMLNDSSNLPVRKFYKAVKSGADWKGGLESPLPFNDDKINTGNGALSADKKRFYFTKCELNWQQKMICSIYMSKLESGKWTDAVKLNKLINTPNYTATQPTLGIESKSKSEVLYFVSDRKGGRGGNDIWYSVYDQKKKEFREPRNAGSKLNTSGNEMTPYYDMESHALFFSSSGWPGLGGLDVFNSVGELKTWSPPQNFGPPVNSSTDDIYFIRGSNKEEGFFVSNREGGVSLQSATCCDDIYNFKYKKYIHLAITGSIFEVVDTSRLKYLEKFSSDTKVDDENVKFQKAAYDNIRSGNYKLLPHTPLTLSLITSEGTEVPLKTDSADEKGEYFFRLESGNDYRLSVGSKTFFLKKINISTKNMMVSDTIHKHVGIKRIPLGPIIIKNIYYPFDKAFLTPESQKTIDTTLLRFLNENPTTIVELSSHTDSKGTDEYNVKLSQKRAESVLVYLTSKGISIDRLQAKGYGENKPIAPNEKPDKSDNPDGRQMNRRTEFKIIGFLKEQEIIYED